MIICFLFITKHLFASRDDEIEKFETVLIATHTHFFCAKTKRSKKKWKSDIFMLFSLKTVFLFA